MVQPAICRLAGLTSFGIAPARKAACTSAMALMTLLAQSPEAMKEAVGCGVAAAIQRCWKPYGRRSGKQSGVSDGVALPLVTAKEE